MALRNSCRLLTLPLERPGETRRRDLELVERRRLPGVGSSVDDGGSNYRPTRCWKTKPNSSD